MSKNRILSIILLLWEEYEESKESCKYMTKLSELAGKFTEVNVKLDKIAVDVLALKDAAPTTDPELPEAAEAELVALSNKVKAIEDIITPPVVVPPVDPQPPV